MLSDAPTRRPKARRTPIGPAGRDRIVRDFAGRWEAAYLAGERFPLLRALSYTPAHHQSHVEEWLFATARAAQPNAFRPRAES